MNTYSHLLMTMVLDKQMKDRQVSVHSTGLLLGSVMPDAALVVLTIGYWVYRWSFLPFTPGEGPFGAMYDRLFFTHPLWISGHNLFHAPLMVLMILGLGYYAIRTQRVWGPAVFWFAVGCGFHSIIDIFTHANDGPLLFFPFEWSYRFSSPVSYWDPSYYGTLFAIGEHLLILAILAYFAANWANKRAKRLSGLSSGAAKRGAAEQVKRGAAKLAKGS